MPKEKLHYDKFYKYASLYDYFQKGVKGDIKFYLGYFKNFKSKILEIGAGTGRITIPLAKRGLDITALDIAPQMLKMLRVKAEKFNLPVKIICADARKLKIINRDKFDAIIVTFRTFQHFYSVNDQLNVLENIRKNLKPDGVLIFDIYKPDFKYIRKGDWQWQGDESIIIPEKKGTIRIDYRNRYDMVEQIMYQEYRFRYPGGKKETAPLKMRFFFRFEIEHLLRVAGFRVKHLYGDFRKNKFKNNSPEMVWIAVPNSEN